MSAGGKEGAFARRRAAAAFAAAAAAFAAVAAVRRGDALPGFFEARAGRARDRLVLELRGKRGLEFHAALDGGIAADSVTGLPLGGRGALAVPGVAGEARRLDGLSGEVLVAPVQRWAPFARHGLTLSLWIRFPGGGDPGAERRVVWDVDGGAGIGLRLRGGLLEAVVGDASGLRAIAVPAPAPGVFAHVALTVGNDRAALFVDGRELGSAELSGLPAYCGHLLALGTGGLFPARADVDEWSVWRRALDSGEIAALAAARRSVPEVFEPALFARVRRRERAAAACRSVFAAFASVGTALRGQAVFDRSVPVLELGLSRSDRRHFAAALADAARSGFRTPAGAKKRRVQATFRGATDRVAAWLDENAAGFAPGARPALVLASEHGLFGGGSGVVRLFPPEQFGERRPDAATPLPLDPGVFVRLHLDGDFLGLYCLVPFEGPAPPWFATGARDVARPDRMHFSARAADTAAGAGMSAAERGAAWNRTLELLRGDPRFPLSRAGAELLARRHARRRADARVPDPAAVSGAEGGAPAGPARGSLPALDLHFGRALDRHARTEFACRFAPADGAPEWFSGTGSCGAKLRGNTSYVAGRRRSVNLKFDVPAAVPGGEPARRLLLLSGYADATRLRNALCFDLFRAMSPEGVVRAPEVFWAEVSANGAPAGVWECCRRPQDCATERFSDLFKAKTPAGLWTSASGSAEAVDRVGGSPAGPDDPNGAFRELVRFVAESSPEEFAARAPDVFDLGELADFFLLVNFTGNEDARVANQYAGRRESDGRWLLLPWDCDKTFLVPPAGRASRSGLLVSPLFDRLLRDEPSFRGRVETRWRELRAGPLSEAALDAWIDARSEALAPYMDADYRVVPPLGAEPDFAANVRALRTQVRNRLSLLDRWLAPR